MNIKGDAHNTSSLLTSPQLLTAFTSVLTIKTSFYLILKTSGRDGFQASVSEGPAGRGRHQRAKKVSRKATLRALASTLSLSPHVSFHTPPPSVLSVN
jgi:hypothetical protein